MIVVAVIPTVGIPVVETLAGQVDPATSNLLTGTVFGALILGGPILLALVALVYRFFMRDPTAVGVHSTVQSPRRKSRGPSSV